MPWRFAKRIQRGQTALATEAAQEHPRAFCVEAPRRLASRLILPTHLNLPFSWLTSFNNSITLNFKTFCAL